MMSETTQTLHPRTSPDAVEQHLLSLKLSFMAAHYGDMAQHAAQKQWSHVDYLASLAQGEADLRRDRATQNRIRLARFPVMKTLEQFRWDWPTRINRLQVQHHFSLGFMKDKSNLIYLALISEFIPLSFWYDAPLISRYSDRRHHLWPVYGSLTYGPARWSSSISPA